MSSKVFDRDHVHRGSVTALNFAQGLSLKRASINAGAVSAKLPAAVRSVEDLLRRNADAKRILSGEKQVEKRSAWRRVRDATDVGIRAAKGCEIPNFSAVFHSFRLIFGRAIISWNAPEAWMLSLERARAERSR